jgi:hypothetical protein
MPRIRMIDTAMYLAGHVPFRGANISAERFYRLSPAPMHTSRLNGADQEALITAAMRNRKHYLPYCAECDEIVEWDHSGMRVWMHIEEALADHVAVQVSHENAHIPPADGLAYVVWSYGMPIVWVLNDGTIVQATTELEPRQVKHLAKILQNLTPNHVTKH